uniref:Acetylcholinesterase tetramerisation domain-containing protein n=1 Tax=Buteo japonicus TaxID=224669 RepID=A0A8C0AZJ0_9AVES
MEEAERQWRLEFHRWSSYMMRWKSQFEHYSRQDSYMMRWKSQFEHYSRQERCHQL